MVIGSASPQNKILRILYGSMFFFSFHGYIFLYIQSTFISQYINEEFLSLIYALGAVISLLTLYFIPKIFGRISDRDFTLILVGLEALICFILAFSQIPFLIVFAFILQQALIPILAFAIDILIEDFSKNQKVGMIRGITFTAANLTAVSSPVLAGYLGTKFGFGTIFYLSILFLIPLFILIFRLRKKIHEPTYHNQSVIKTAIQIHRNLSKHSRNVQMIFMVNFFLQFFYTWIIIYSPLYLLHQGFNWDQIGVMFSIMLLPFLLFELPLGIIADKWLGEKEILSVGFIILGVSTLSIAFIHSQSMIVWATILLLTRVGACFVEIMSETYFFKQVHKTETPVISLFRFTRPLSLLFAPPAAAFTILLSGESGSFLVLGLLMFFGLRFVYPLVDTK